MAYVEPKLRFIGYASNVVLGHEPDKDEPESLPGEGPGEVFSTEW